jgi:hypothetical protein
MVKVDGRVSEAVVTNVDTEVEGTIGMLFVDLDAPISELAHWRGGHRLCVEARWQPKYFPFPLHPSLIEILGSCSVQGSFIAHLYTLKNRLSILLQSAGELKPLEGRRPGETM